MVRRNKSAIAGALAFLAALFCLLLAPLALHADQEVRVLVEVDEEGRLGDRSAALEQALRLGVLQEAEALLRGRLDEARQGLLREALSGLAVEYVLGYAEQEPEITGWGAVLHVDVRVNRQALRGFLQSIGLYYTLDRPVGYALEAGGLAAADAALVADMETLSGLRRGGAGSPVLRLSRDPGRGWQGVLGFEGQTWSAQAADLPRLWAALWGNYFALDRVRQGFEQRLLLTTRGWSSAVDAQGFDLVLRGWGLEAGEVRMVGVSLGPGRVQAGWEIVTMDDAGLQARLEAALRERGIDYVLTPFRSNP